MLEIRLLGPLEVLADDRAVEIRRRKQRALLAALALRAGDPVSPDRLVEELWGERAPKTARHALENYVSELRKTLGRDAIRTGPAGYALAIDSDRVDANRFERLVADARGQDASQRAETLAAALGLVRGPPLADLAFEPFAGAAVGRLQELELTAREERAEAELELGRHAHVIADLERLVAEYPYRERPRAQLMLALYRSGRQAEALAAYQEGRRILVDELGIDPGEALQQLERAILRQDPTLRAVTPGPTPAAGRPTAQLASRPARKAVTILRAELANLGALAGALDPEQLRVVTDRYRSAARTAVEGHEGLCARVAGETVVAVFGVPTTHEDDALRALRTAHDLRDAVGILNDGLLPEHGIFLEIRTAVTTGEVLVTPDEPDLVTGRPVAAADELQGAARPGQILFDGDTFRLVQTRVGAEPVAGVAEEAYRLVELGPDVHGRVLKLDSPLVGRRRQLLALVNAFESAVADRTLHLFTLLGPPGVGKSRLVRELAEALGDSARLVAGRCAPYGDSLALQPLLAALEEAGDDRGERTDGLSVGALQTRFERLALEHPLVVVLDDVQWATPTLLEAVESIADSSRGSPWLLVAVARPELLENRPGWGGGKPNATSLLLEPLSDGEADRLIDNLLGESDLPDPIRDHVVRTADGNPLFVEELLAALVDRAILTRDAGRWTSTQTSAVPLPPSIRALIAARLDRLPDDERLVVELGAIDGKIFGAGTVRRLASSEPAVDVDAAIAALIRKEFVRPQPADEDRYAFRHQLIRDVAYASIPMQRRAELHDELADLADAAGASPDRRAVVDYHRDRARRYRAELGSGVGSADQDAGSAT